MRIQIEGKVFDFDQIAIDRLNDLLANEKHVTPLREMYNRTTQKYEYTPAEGPRKLSTRLVSDWI